MTNSSSSGTPPTGGPPQPPPPPPPPPQGGGYYPPPPSGGYYPPPPPPPAGGYPQYSEPPGSAYPPPPPGAYSSTGVSGAGYPQTGAPAGAYPPPPPKPPGPPANFKLGALFGPKINIKVPIHTLKFDEQYFLQLLAGSISLTKDEKWRIVQSIPKLKQTQIDELIRIFEEERRKFAELGQEHVPQLTKLAKQHYEDWMDLEIKQQQEAEKSEDQQKADEIRKNLGI